MPPSSRKIKLPVNKLLVGLMVDLELSWTKHPFLFSKFKISDQADIAVIKQLGLKEVTVFPDQSDIDLAKQEKETTKTEFETEQTAKVASEEKWEDKKSKVAEADKYRKKRSNIAKRYKAKAAKVRKLVHELKTEPANAIHNASDLVDDLAADFDSENAVMTNLVNLGSGDHTLYDHCINVTILSLSLANVRGVNGDRMRLLARGALLHDVGKVELPGPILNKKTTYTPAEYAVYQKHTQIGKRLCELVEDTPPEVLDIIECHHEFIDGSGFPGTHSGDEISELARIVAIANTYDELCNPRDPAKALTPKIAMATMFSKFKNKLDHEMVQTFISTLGVYPPGSIVSLNDGNIGLVVAVDPHEMLKPEVLLYNPDIPPLQALIINLKEHPELKIENVLKPGEYPPRVYEYLGVEERIGYMTSKRT